MYFFCQGVRQCGVTIIVYRIGLKFTDKNYLPGIYVIISHLILEIVTQMGIVNFLCCVYCVGTV